MAGDHHPGPRSLRTLLSEWGVSEDVINNFTENGMTIDLLCELTAANLKELCPHMGTRLMLKIKIQQYIDSQDECGSNDANIEEDSTNTDNDSAGGSSNNTENILDVPDHFRDLNISELLRTSPEGASIFAEYETMERLSPANQQSLINVTGRWLYPWLQNDLMKQDHYLSIIKKINETFPREPIGVYFMAPIPKRSGHTHKPVPMRGKLPDKIRNITFMTGTSRKRKSQNNAESTGEVRQQRYDELLATHDEDIKWLKNNREPWELVEQKWSSTFEMRENSIHKCVYDFIKEWDILNDLRSTSLISLDFEHLYPGKGDSFAAGWPTFFDRVKTMRIHKYSNDKMIQSLKEVISEIGSGPECNDLKLAIELSMLAYLVPPRGRISNKNKHSTIESLDFMFTFVENPGDINTKIEDQKKRALEKKETVQPYIIIQGNIRKHNQVLLVIDDIKYQFSSATSGFDSLFKSFHVLQAQYPKASTHLHLLIQRCLYKFKTVHDILPLNIIDIVDVM